MNVVEIKNLTVEYPNVRALDNVSLSIKQNDFLGIIGPNGAGKSTLFACMLGILQQYNGEIYFLAKTYVSQKSTSVRWVTFHKSQFLRKTFLQPLKR